MWLCFSFQRLILPQELFPQFFIQEALLAGAMCGEGPGEGLVWLSRAFWVRGFFKLLPAPLMCWLRYQSSRLQLAWGCRGRIRKCWQRCREASGFDLLLPVTPEPPVKPCKHRGRMEEPPLPHSPKPHCTPCPAISHGATNTLEGGRSPPPLHRHPL